MNNTVLTDLQVAFTTIGVDLINQGVPIDYSALVVLEKEHISKAG